MRTITFVRSDADATQQHMSMDLQSCYKAAYRHLVKLYLNYRAIITMRSTMSSEGAMSSSMRSGAKQHSHMPMPEGKKILNKIQISGVEWLQFLPSWGPPNQGTLGRLCRERAILLSFQFKCNDAWPECPTGQYLRQCETAEA